MRRLTIVIVLAALFAAGTAFARRISWKPREQPPVSLQQALELAKADLNEDGYFCIGASLAKTLTQGDWELQYCNKDGKNIWVSVGSDRSVRKSNQGFAY